jgi:hypothetical protein
MLVLALSLAGCPKEETAVVKCGKLEKFKGDIGNLNSPNFSLGSIIVLDSKASPKSGSYLTSVSIPGSAQNPSPPVASADETFASSLTVSMSASIPAGVQADIATALNQDTSVTVRNLKRVSVNDVAAIVDASPAAKKSVATILQAAKPGVMVAIISTVSYADSTILNVKNASTLSSGAKLLTYGDYKLTVTYSCSDSVNRTGNQFGAFFKATLLAYDAKNDHVVASPSQNVDFSEYDLSNALTTK